MRWMSMIAGRILLPMFAAAVFTGGAIAQEAGQEARESGAAKVPTVTILNGNPAGDQKPRLPELEVSPDTPSASAPAGTKLAGEEAPRESARTVREPAPGSSPSTASRAKPAEKTAEKKTAAPAPRPSPTLSVDIDLARQVMTVSEDGDPLHTWHISTGRYGYHTPTGTYRPTWMSKMWYSRQYDMSPMPHAIFFHKGVAIHGTYDTRSLGRPASHGCVRLTPKNAATLYKLVTEHGKDRTQIVVHGKPTHRVPDAQVAADTPRRGERTERLRRGAPAYRYLPPSYYGRAPAYPPRGFYDDPPRSHRYSASTRRPPRGLYGGYTYGYGF